jgi:hypothetical protein
MAAIVRVLLTWYDDKEIPAFGVFETKITLKFTESGKAAVKNSLTEVYNISTMEKVIFLKHFSNLENCLYYPMDTYQRVLATSKFENRVQNLEKQMADVEGILGEMDRTSLFSLCMKSLMKSKL